jgi:hypothetical protein
VRETQYAIGAENSTWIAPKLENNHLDGIATVYLANRVVPEHKIRSRFGPDRRDENPTTLPEALRADEREYWIDNCSSASGQTMFAPLIQFKGQGDRWLGALVIDGFDDIDLYSPQINSDDRPYIFVTTERKSGRGLYVQALQTTGRLAEGTPERGIETALGPGDGFVGGQVWVQTLHASIDAVHVRPHRIDASRRADPPGVYVIRRSSFEWNTPDIGWTVHADVTEDSTSFVRPGA